MQDDSYPAGEKKEPDHRAAVVAYGNLQQYVQQERSDTWLFPGQHPGRHLTERAVEGVRANGIACRYREEGQHAFP
ncbi:hypothetical protein [Paenibacillus hemerocallicola]|uniref:hypothetical protein n=1 Tax=Paenibacillus hemerocallicola TaxID=1172614 RepID=UPI00159EF120|nr:hypothetical protein [Paenibacillus hemerocallicola]